MVKKIIVSLVVINLILIGPIYFLNSSIKEKKMYSDLSDGVKYIENFNAMGYRFTNREAAEKALNNLNKNSYAILQGEDLIVDAYICEEKPIINYTQNGKVNENPKFIAEISNGEPLPGIFYTYQVSSFIAESDLLKVTDGKMLDTNKQDKDKIQIMVTDGLGLKVDDEVYLTVNGLNKDFKQVVVKAQVVGIVAKGSFLYGVNEYCGRPVGPENLHESIFDKETIFVGDISYLYDIEKSPNDTMDKDISVVVIGEEDTFKNETTKKLIKENKGEIIINNISKINTVSFEENLKTINVKIVVFSVLIAIILLTDIFFIIKLIKKR